MTCFVASIANLSFDWCCRKRILVLCFIKEVLSFLMHFQTQAIWWCFSSQQQDTRWRGSGWRGKAADARAEIHHRTTGVSSVWECVCHGRVDDDVVVLMMKDFDIDVWMWIFWFKRHYFTSIKMTIRLCAYMYSNHAQLLSALCIYIHRSLEFKLIHVHTGRSSSIATASWRTNSTSSTTTHSSGLPRT